jgi:hypothetical protein
MPGCRNAASIPPSSAIRGSEQCPEAYDLDAKFAPYVERLEAQVKAEEARRKNKGRPQKISGPLASTQLMALKYAKQRLATDLDRVRGWLTFFFADDEFRITGLRFDHASRYGHLALSGEGFFGHQLFSPAPALQLPFSDLIVVDSPWDQLQLPAFSANNARLHVHEKGRQTRAGAHEPGGAKGQTEY